MTAKAKKRKGKKKADAWQGARNVFKPVSSEEEDDDDDEKPAVGRGLVPADGIVG